MLGRVEVEHEVDQRACKAGAGAAQDREPRPGYARGAFEVEDAERRAEIPVRLGFEIERGRHAVTPHLPVLLLRRAFGNRVVRQVGKGERHATQLVLHLLQLRFLLLDDGAVLLALGDQVVGRLPRPLRGADTFPGSLARMTRRLKQRENGAALGVELNDAVEFAVELIHFGSAAARGHRRDGLGAGRGRSSAVILSWHPKALCYDPGRCRRLPPTSQP